MPEITTQILQFTASDGYPLLLRAYVPHVEPKGHIVCLHGIQSHGGWYTASCMELAAAGYIVSYLDRRGSGLNWKARGDIPHYRRLLDDIREFIAADGIDIPVTLMATSWAGKLAVVLATEKNLLFDRLVLLCPGLFPQVQAPLSVRMGVAASRITQPTKLYPIPLNDPGLFTDNPQALQLLQSDPLSLHEATARLLVESFWLDKALARVKELPAVPILLLLAGQDRIIRNDLTRSWLQRVAPRSTILEFPDAHHTLEFEKDRTWLRSLLAW
ncbi:MAG TPA: alpha/beta fold hydrolase, partial [Gemmatales bacterium]|nr:alpha/beta fold hydrolase [Gemmatales bacterium]